MARPPAADQTKRSSSAPDSSSVVAQVGLAHGSSGGPKRLGRQPAGQPRHLKRGVNADLQAHGRIVTDVEERERLLAPIARSWQIDLGLMVASAPLVEVTFP